MVDGSEAKRAMVLEQVGADAKAEEKMETYGME